MSESDANRVEQQIVALATNRPIFYYDILRELEDEDYRTIMLAFGQIRAKELFERDEKGRYVVKTSTPEDN
jgi:hypothetical protein